MKLKDYQNDVLESLSGYLGALAEKRQEAEDYVQFQKEQRPQSGGRGLLPRHLGCVERRQQITALPGQGGQ